MYSDRLRQWDSDKFKKYSLSVFGNEADYFNERSPRKISEFLSLYFDRKVVVIKITEWCNVATGYPVWSFEFVYTEPEK